MVPLPVKGKLTSTLRYRIDLVKGVSRALMHGLSHS